MMTQPSKTLKIKAKKHGVSLTKIIVGQSGREYRVPKTKEEIEEEIGNTLNEVPRIPPPKTPRTEVARKFATYPDGILRKRGKKRRTKKKNIHAKINLKSNINLKTPK